MSLNLLKIAPFVPLFEKNWHLIYSEYLLIKDQTVPWPEFDIYEGNWRTFGLFDFPLGNKTSNTNLAPFTSHLIENYIPSHGAAGYSILKANTVIEPHMGYQGDYLRIHLGLEIPDGDCGLRSQGGIKRWTEGKIFIFDDRLIHEAWNKTENDRVALIIDFIPEKP
ncbi:aspartyl/asparaginyl beta-hydroxylase domain-containing protein [Shewanella surugensis]|uniref:Aspartyl/asparaginyl beta-hydroxylase domain-containing protein n=1 Tax=Shewanella surugensis TaxID=212020 RepID=A0ABT0LGY5_9GAMM|nr:aspartyl/asparaginyl beta-hydroxylase domain-containing protein [Shewanella surugensis]MCL1126597.1 aspartyl/asparaginyl beta-hydroxylase domain-containing protein [Shewanella surugensis]